jgi:PleD family two-component response regulator
MGSMTATQDRESATKERTLRSVAVVARNPDLDVLDVVLDSGDYDVVFIESLADAYSRLRQTAPELIVLCVDIDDAEAFQLFSMLKLDAETSRIPIVTYVTLPDPAASAGDAGEEIRADSLLRTALPLSMN